MMGPRGLTISIVILSVVTVANAETAASDAVVPELESSPLMLLQRAQSLVHKAAHSSDVLTKAPQQDWEQVQGASEAPVTSNVPSEQDDALLSTLEGSELIQAPQQDWEQVQGVSEAPVTSNVPSEQPLLDALEGSELIQKPKSDWEQVQGMSEAPVTSNVPSEQDDALLSTLESEMVQAPAGKAAAAAKVAKAKAAAKAKAVKAKAAAKVKKAKAKQAKKADAAKKKAAKAHLAKKKAAAKVALKKKKAKIQANMGAKLAKMKEKKAAQAKKAAVEGKTKKFKQQQQIKLRMAKAHLRAEKGAKKKAAALQARKAEKLKWQLTVKKENIQKSVGTHKVQQAKKQAKAVLRGEEKKMRMKEGAAKKKILAKDPANKRLLKAERKASHGVRSLSKSRTRHMRRLNRINKSRVRNMRAHVLKRVRQQEKLASKVVKHYAHKLGFKTTPTVHFRHLHANVVKSLPRSRSRRHRKRYGKFVGLHYATRPLVMRVPHSRRARHGMLPMLPWTKPWPHKMRRSPHKDRY